MHEERKSYAHIVFDPDQFNQKFIGIITYSCRPLSSLNLGPTEDLKSNYKTMIRILSGANTNPVRGYGEKSSQLRTSARYARFRFLIAKIALHSL